MSLRTCHVSSNLNDIFLLTLHNTQYIHVPSSCAPLDRSLILATLLYLSLLSQYITGPYIRCRQCYDLCEARAFALTSTSRPPCAILWQESVASQHVDVVLCGFVDKMVTAIQKTLAITIDVIVFTDFVHCVWVVWLAARCRSEHDRDNILLLLRMSGFGKRLANSRGCHEVTQLMELRMSAFCTVAISVNENR
jgi:hypothetical protein